MDDLNELRNQQQNSPKCEICDKEFKSNKDLKRHVNIVHEKKKLFHCEFCNHNFSQQYVLVNHITAVHASNGITENRPEMKPFKV